MAKLALLGGPKAKTRPFPAWPQYDDRERAALAQVLESRVWWRTPGTQTAAFEQEFSAFHGARYGIAVTNGTHALEVTLEALGVGRGDEVIVPDFTFVATASAVLFCGAVPVFADVMPDTFCLDPDAAERSITARTRAIIAVHMGGHPADLDRLTQIARCHSIPLVEDCAHAHSSRWNGRCVGTHGVAGTFSFQASKLMTAGEGGIVITSDPGFERRARSVHDCGRLDGRWFYDHFVYGSNYRLPEWQGAVLRVQLSRLAEQTERRHRNARLLDSLLSSIRGVTPQALAPTCDHNGHYAYIYHWDAREFGGISRARYLEAITAEGIPEQASYPALHGLDLFRDGAYADRIGADAVPRMREIVSREYPQSDRAALETVWIPQAALLGDEEDMREIAAAIMKVKEHVEDLKPRS